MSLKRKAEAEADENEAELRARIVFKKKWVLKIVQADPQRMDIDMAGVREAAVMRRLQDADCADFIVQLKTITVEPRCMTLVTKRFSRDLHAAWCDQGMFSEEFVVQILFRVIGALHRASERGIAHNDVKPANVFLDDFDPASARLGDWGIAEFRSTSTTTEHRYVQTVPYRAPENLLCMTDAFDPTVADCWSCGILGLELLGLREPTDLLDPRTTMARLVAQFGFQVADFPYWSFRLLRTFNISLSRPTQGTARFPDGQLGDLLRGLLQMDPTRRLSARAALGHPLFVGAGPGAVVSPVSRRVPVGLTVFPRQDPLLRAVAVRAMQRYTATPREFVLAVAIADFVWQQTDLATRTTSRGDRVACLWCVDALVGAVVGLSQKLLNNDSVTNLDVDQNETHAMECAILHVSQGDLWFSCGPADPVSLFDPDPTRARALAQRVRSLK